jgi:restriction system protein
VSVTDPAKVGELLRTIDGYSGQPNTALALKLAPLLFFRPGELRGAEQAEFDLDDSEWRIPGSRMKMGEQLIVPLSRLSGMTPVRPILQLQTDDPRFIEGHEVASQLQEGYNLATMAWEEFEHLVRQLFEEEFRKGDAEVHVTRASSDGGVDAVILDPDPIHGGKIVIQAKRYTNTVGLSAVRDLYGTVINEGANRGILVSTADYGPDAYEFVKGKPLTLLSGSNLLHLLAAHGHRARIDLKEAKLVNKAAKQN